MVSDDYGGFESDGFVGNSFCKVDGEEDGVGLAAGADDGCFD